MRTRLVRPEYWSDSHMADLPIATRHTYIGLWCLADDDGYLSWSARDIGAALYRYDSVRRRERMIERHLSELVEAGRVQLLDCGVHGLIPSLPHYRIQGGKHSRQYHENHTAKCPVLMDKYRSPSVSVSESVYVSGSESVSEPAGAGSNDPEKTWRDLGAKWGKKPRLVQA